MCRYLIETLKIHQLPLPDRAVRECVCGVLMTSCTLSSGLWRLYEVGRHKWP